MQLIYALIGTYLLSRGSELPSTVFILIDGARYVNRICHIQPVLRLKPQQTAVTLGYLALKPAI